MYICTYECTYRRQNMRRCRRSFFHARVQGRAYGKHCVRRAPRKYDTYTHTHTSTTHTKNKTRSTQVRHTHTHTSTTQIFKSQCQVLCMDICNINMDRYSYMDIWIHGALDTRTTIIRKIQCPTTLAIFRPSNYSTKICPIYVICPICLALLRPSRCIEDFWGCALGHMTHMSLICPLFDPYVLYMDFSKNERVDRYARSFSPTISPGAVVCSK
jgi:hypothetical protein